MRYTENEFFLRNIFILSNIILASDRKPFARCSRYQFLVNMTNSNNLFGYFYSFHLQSTSSLLSSIDTHV